jgi:hypothetical protein
MITLLVTAVVIAAVLLTVLVSAVQLKVSAAIGIFTVQELLLHIIILRVVYFNV